jgi:thiosulfate/3-mercaptopyruvate sulfurtransferase
LLRGAAALVALCGFLACAGNAPPASTPSAAAPLPTLISGDSLAVTMARESVTVLDVRQPWADYLLNHLPQAAWAHVESFRAVEGGLPFQLLSDTGYRDLFQRLGVDPEHRVVIYSAGDANDIDATYVAWLLSALGHPHVAVLDGGYAKWVLDNRPLARTYPRPAPAARLTGRFRPEFATRAEVERAVLGGDALLVDARNAQQYAGSAGAQRRRGHIPGALNHPWAGDLETRDLALVWKPLGSLRTSYVDQGILPDRDIIVYCNTGTEASHVWFALRALLGYPRVRIYTGAWSEWAERDDLPIATGR